MKLVFFFFWRRVRSEQHNKPQKFHSEQNAKSNTCLLILSCTIFDLIIFLPFLSPYKPELVTELAGTMRSGSSQDVICLPENPCATDKHKHTHTLLER